MTRARLYIAGGLVAGSIVVTGWTGKEDPSEPVGPEPEIPVLTELGGDIDLIYAHEVRFKPEGDAGQILRNIKAEAAKSRAPVLIVDIEDYRWVNQNIGTVRAATRAIRREGRQVGWYMWPHVDDSLTHDYSGVDVIYVPGHSPRTQDVAVPRGIELAVKHDKPLIIQYGHRMFGEGARWITPAELRADVKWLRQIHNDLVERGAPGLIVCIWSSDHNTLARREGTQTFRSEPRWGEDEVIEFGEHLEDLLNGREPEPKLGVVVTEPVVQGWYADGRFTRERLIDVCRSYRLRGRPISILPSSSASLNELDAAIRGEPDRDR